jgi:hypothetical protein
LTINKHVLMLNRLEEELKDIAGQVPGVTSVETKVGPGYYQTMYTAARISKHHRRFCWWTMKKNTSRPCPNG